jgi:hypothetical protein
MDVAPFRAAQIVGARFAFFCFAGSCQRPPKARRRCVRERSWKPLLRVCECVSHVDDCCQDIELNSGGLENRRLRNKCLDHSNFLESGY